MARKVYEPRIVVAIGNYIFREMMHETVVDEVKIHTRLLFHSAIMNYKLWTERSVNGRKQIRRDQ